MLPDDPPGKRAVAVAREEVRERLSGLTPPLPKGAYATGGTARALRRLNGRVFGEKELETALKRLARSSSSELAREFGLDVERAWTLVGGAVVLAEVQLRLVVPFEVSRAGMREGVAATTLAELAAALRTRSSTSRPTSKVSRLGTFASRGTHAISSTSSCGENSPARGRIRNQRTTFGPRSTR